MICDTCLYHIHSTNGLLYIEIGFKVLLPCLCMCRCMYTILCTKWCIMNIVMLWCCVMCVHISSADINTMCVLLMLCLQIASHSQPPHPLPHLLAPTPPHKNLVSKALHSQCWTHIYQTMHVLAILSATNCSYCTSVFINTLMCVCLLCSHVYMRCGLMGCGQWTSWFGYHQRRQDTCVTS